MWYHVLDQCPTAVSWLLYLILFVCLLYALNDLYRQYGVVDWLRTAEDIHGMAQMHLACSEMEKLGLSGRELALFPLLDKTL
jgi:hypothetical protein